jgi:hypothetical protein
MVRVRQPTMRFYRSRVDLQPAAYAAQLLLTHRRLRSSGTRHPARRSKHLPPARPPTSGLRQRPATASTGSPSAGRVPPNPPENPPPNPPPNPLENMSQNTPQNTPQNVAPLEPTTTPVTNTFSSPSQKSPQERKTTIKELAKQTIDCNNNTDYKLTPFPKKSEEFHRFFNDRNWIALLNFLYINQTVKNVVVDILKTSSLVDLQYQTKQISARAYSESVQGSQINYIEPDNNCFFTAVAKAINYYNCTEIETNKIKKKMVPLIYFFNKISENLSVTIMMK